MRLITIDNGNSNPHIGIFEDTKLISVIPLQQYSKQPDDYILISDVGAPLDIRPSFDLKTKRHSKEHPFFFDMPIAYSESLGDDRLFLSYFVFKKLKQHEKILIIDAGTFITLDIVDSHGFLGGHIYPGIKTFLASYSKGSRLPHLSAEKIKTVAFPHSTDEAILSATDQYLEFILEGMIKKIKPDKIFLTGGSLELIQTKLRFLNLTIPLERDPHSIHSALALLFHYHLQKAVF